MRIIVSRLEGESLNGQYDAAVYAGALGDFISTTNLIGQIRLTNLGTATYRYACDDYDLLVVARGYAKQFYVRNAAGFWVEWGLFDNAQELRRFVGPLRRGRQPVFMRTPLPSLELRFQVMPGATIIVN